MTLTEGAPARQVVQHLRTGTIELLELPAPRPLSHEVLIRTRCSLLSAGTERMLLEFGRAGLIGKALQQPERVRQLLERLRTDGIGPVLDAAFTKLDEPLPLGYANVGVVVEVGAHVQGFRVGERVVSNAAHASWARVSTNLCARIPDSVSDEHAAFVVPAAIALQGVRLAEPTLGECFTVIGTGLIGLLAVQLLAAAGCPVIAVDTRADRLAMAARFGARTIAADDPDVAERVRELTAGRGADGVLVTAATDSDAPMHAAAQMSRKRGRVILVGVAGLRLSRADFYAKELKLQVSCSYGPGRYDPQYEARGHDYPLPFVRWTEQRNFEAVLDLLATGRLAVGPLISHRFAFGEARRAYEALLSDPGALGILLEYDGEPASPAAAVPLRAAQDTGRRPATAPVLGMIGAGAYARRFLLPALRDSGARLLLLAAQGSPAAGWAARTAGFETLTSDAAAVIGGEAIDALVIATRHDSHAHYVCAALRAGKHVFVEKPLALTTQELEDIESAYAHCPEPKPILMVGFNRRYAPHALELHRRLRRVPGPRCLIYTVNAGSLPPEHWNQDPDVGGGRLIGEACHFIDLMRFLVGRPITAVTASALPGRGGQPSDSATITLRFADDSIGTLHYLAQGARRFPKERLEVFGAGETWQLDNFRSLTSYAARAPRLLTGWRQDKGNRACVRAFVTALRAGQPSPMDFAELVEVTRATLEAARQARAYVRAADGPAP